MDNNTVVNHRCGGKTTMAESFHEVMPHRSSVDTDAHQVLLSAALKQDHASEKHNTARHHSEKHARSGNAAQRQAAEDAYWINRFYEHKNIPYYKNGGVGIQFLFCESLRGSNTCKGRIP
jgi:hypothetical protein